MGATLALMGLLFVAAMNPRLLRGRDEAVSVSGSVGVSLHRDFNADHGTTVSYEPYCERLATPGLVEWMQSAFEAPVTSSYIDRWHRGAFILLPAEAYRPRGLSRPGRAFGGAG